MLCAFSPVPVLAPRCLSSPVPLDVLVCLPACDGDQVRKEAWEALLVAARRQGRPALAVQQGPSQGARHRSQVAGHKLQIRSRKPQVLTGHALHQTQGTVPRVQVALLGLTPLAHAVSLRSRSCVQLVQKGNARLVFNDLKELKT